MRAHEKEKYSIVVNSKIGMKKKGLWLKDRYKRAHKLIVIFQHSRFSI